MLKKQQQASITVEAAFLIPIIIVAIMALIYLTFYLHDRVRLEEVVEKALGQGNFLMAQRSQAEGKACNYAYLNEPGNWGYLRSSYETDGQEIKNYISENLNQGFFLLEEEDVFCKADGFSIVVKVKMKASISLNPVKNFWKETPEFVLERSVSIHKPEEILRAYDGLQMVIDSTSGFLFVKNYIENLKAVIE